MAMRTVTFALLAVVDAQDEIGMALVADSECTSASDEDHCSLNALQLRGRAMDSEVTGAEARPKCGRFGCDSPYRRWYTCQCNSKCLKYNNCCWDYEAVCAKPSTETTTLPPSAPAPSTTQSFVTAPPAGITTTPPANRSAKCSAIPSCARLNLGGDCCPAPNGLYLGCCPESIVPHATAPPPTVIDGQNTLTVYHQTSPDACASILKTNFRIGHGGWCGDAIYFALSPEATKTKAITPHSGIGRMLEVVVNVGNKLKFPCCRFCGGKQGEHVYWTNSSLAAQGYNSIEINPGDGPEIIVYDKEQILSIKEITFNKAWTPHRMTYRE